MPAGAWVVHTGNRWRGAARIQEPTPAASLKGPGLHNSVQAVIGPRHAGLAHAREGRPSVPLREGDRAAALASVGRLDEAAGMARTAMESARAEGRTKLAEGIGQRLALYERGRRRRARTVRGGVGAVDRTATGEDSGLWPASGATAP